MPILQVATGGGGKCTGNRTGELKKKEDLNLHCNPYFLKNSGTSKTKC